MEQLVSVIIPTYKRPEKLSRAIDSVLNQTYGNIEIVVVDDNNPDTDGRAKTEAIMSAYADNPKVRYIKHPYNKNGSAARNTGARNASGSFLALLDDDDEFLPEKIETQLKVLDTKDSSYGMCYSAFISVKPGGKEIRSNSTVEGALFLPALKKELAIAAGSNLLIRKSAFDEVGGFDERFKRSQDLELLAKLLQKYKLAYCPTVGLRVYIHFDQAIIDFEKLTRDYIELFKPFVDRLSTEEQKEFYKAMSQQVFFYNLRTKKDFIRCLKMLSTQEISFKDAFMFTLTKLTNYLLN